MLDKEGLISDEIDVDCINKTNHFKVELLCHKTNHLRITFTFSQATDYFSNLKLEVESKFNEQGEPMREIKEELKYKTEKVEHSLFTLLFDGSTDINQFYNVASELYQDYSNALYFYFREEDEEDEDDNAIEEEDGEDEDDSEGQSKKKVKVDQ